MPTKSEPIKLSYVLPVYNDQAFIVQAIESLLKQKTKGEIIVIDDASTDNTPRLLRYMTNKYKKIQVIVNQKRKGAAWCRNVGNKAATGNIIVVCDTDINYKERGHAIRTFFKKNPDKDVFSSSVAIMNAEYFDSEMYKQDAQEWDFESKCPISHPTIAYRKEYALKCPYHEKTLDSDLYEFCLLDMHKAGAKFGGCADVLVEKLDGYSKRDVKKAKKLKMDLYKEYGIEVSEEQF